MPRRSGFVDASVRSLREAYLRWFTLDQRGIRSFDPTGEPRGRALLAHVLEGVLPDSEDDIPTHHNHFREARAIVRVLRRLGYAVDVISFRNRYFEPKHHYDLFVSSRVNFELIAPRLPESCIKVTHLDTAHWAFSNERSAQRVIDVQNRRGVTVPSIRPLKMTRAIDLADAATMLGSRYTCDTYAYAGKPILQVPNPATALGPSPADRDWSVARRNFVWMGSKGLVMKGLDLVLEAFRSMPDLALTVLGPIDDDTAFRAEFHEELYRTPNIRVHGWVDVTGEDFRRICASSAGLVYPSCAEGAAGAVVNALHHGLIPIVTPEAGIDMSPEWVVPIDGLKVEAVVDSVRAVADMPSEVLGAYAQAIWETARSTFTVEAFELAYESAMRRIVLADLDDLPRGFVPMGDHMAW